MYQPRAFQETDAATMCAFIRAHRLATFVSTDSDGLCADHIPMLVEAGADGRHVLRGHVARANPLWKNLGEGRDVLVVFQDAGGYITPSWYATKAQSGKVVPTWNYIAVHALGRAHAVDDAGWLRDFLTRLTDANESGRPAPWRITDAPEDYIAMQLQAIVGIEVAVSRLLGKWKMSQNRLPQDVDSVITSLRQRADDASVRMADEIAARRSPAP